MIDRLRQALEEGSPVDPVQHNLEEAAEDRHQRAETVASFSEALRRGPSAWKQYLKRPARRYLLTESTRVQLHRARILDDARYDGKWVLYTTSRQSTEEVAVASNWR